MTQQTWSPIDGRLLVERPFADPTTIDRALTRARRAAAAWRETSLADRQAAVSRFVDAMMVGRDDAAHELTLQIGRPIRHTPGELRGFEDRARVMIGLAESGLADVGVPLKAGFSRTIRREPVGVVLVLSPWNYPLLTAVNAVVPALLAGNAVVLKHSDQTPLVAERFSAAWAAAGNDPDLLIHLHATHEAVAGMVADDRVDLVLFTGSVDGGRAVHQAAAGHFKAVGLELGGKDPAYVRPDADLAYAAENLADGAVFNAGQRCCAIERIYVHRAVFDDFVARLVDSVYGWSLGDPTDSAVSLGPVVRERAAARIRAQVREALAGGAVDLVDPSRYPADRDGTPYLRPSVLVGVTHQMDVMREETFGPVVGVMPVDSDDEAVALMNDSAYGLTASLWTSDEDRAWALGGRLETGTVFMNRCDALDPELAWVGVKHSGRGCTLSRVGYEALTRPKSFHFRTTL